VAADLIRDGKAEIAIAAGRDLQSNGHVGFEAGGQSHRQARIR
jgi:3-oxoacyl-(acyl-carrier-protein) synthase